MASAWSDSLAARHQRELDSLVLNIGIVSAAELTSSLQFRSNRPQIRLGEFLVAARLITPEQLSVARATQVTHPASRLGEILVEQGIITEHTVLMAAAYKLNIPFVNIRNFPIDPAALKLVKSKFASDHLVLPLMCLEHSLVVAVGNPLAKDSTHGLPFLTGRTVVPVFANTDDLRTRIASEYGELDTAITIGVPDGLRAARKAAAPRASWHKLVE